MITALISFQLVKFVIGLLILVLFTFLIFAGLLMFKNNSIERLSRIWGDGIPEIFGFNGVRHYDAVCFHRGYTNTTMSFEYKNLTIGKGNKEWGAPEEDVFIIKLGDRL